MDSNFTPELLINANHSGVSIPFHRVQINDGKLVLNIHERAVNGFHYQDDLVVFKTRFSGQSFEVEIPFEAVIAVYSRETHEGLLLRAFSRAEGGEKADGTAAEASSDKSVPISGRPHLTVVK